MSSASVSEVEDGDGEEDIDVARKLEQDEEPGEWITMDMWTIMVCFLIFALFYASS